VAVLVTKAKRQSPAPGPLKDLNGAGIASLSSTRLPLISRKECLHHEDRAVGNPNPSASGSST